jgi:hypothetical protein
MRDDRHDADATRDAALIAKLRDVGVTRSFAEVRALMARDVWSLEPGGVENAALELGAALDESALDADLLAALAGLRSELEAHAQDGGPIFHLHPVGPSQSADELAARLALRRVETGILMGIFSFNRVLFPELFTALGPLVGSLERTVCGLDKKRALITGSPDVFAVERERREVERALDEVDQVLGQGFTVAARALASHRAVRLGAKTQARRAVAKRQAVAAADRRKARRKSERAARKDSR